VNSSPLLTNITYKKKKKTNKQTNKHTKNKKKRKQQRKHSRQCIPNPLHVLALCAHLVDVSDGAQALLHQLALVVLQVLVSVLHGTHALLAAILSHTDLEEIRA
jgi:hypothetical protein